MSDVTAASTTSVSELSNADLELEITSWAGRVAAGQARMLAAIAEFDAREAWGGPGLLSCAHWLSWRLGLGLKAAHERVRVARRIGDLPTVMAAFGRGELSWSQVRAISRVATSATEQDYLIFAKYSTGAQLERLVRGIRRANRLNAKPLVPVEGGADDGADGAGQGDLRRVAADRLRTRVTYDDDGDLVITVRMPAEAGVVVLAALEAAREDLDRERRAARVGTDVETSPAAAGSSAEEPASDSEAASTSPSPMTAASLPEQTADRSSAEDAVPGEDPATAAVTGWLPASLGEGVLQLCTDYLDARSRRQPATRRRTRTRLTVLVDPVSRWSRLPDGELLPPGVTDGLLRSATDPERAAVAAELTRDDLGRTHREPSDALRELLGHVDGERCRFPGCRRVRRLHAHHVVEWSRSGPTDLANLVLLCPRHHRLVHRVGYVLTLHSDRRLVVRTADGAVVPRVPDPPPPARAEALPATAATASEPYGVDRLDLHYAVAVLTRQAA